MDKIKKYSKLMFDEILDANMYMDMACKAKSSNEEIAEDFMEIAKQELHHKDILHKALKEYVEDYEDKNGKSVEMETILDFVADINSEMEAPVIAKMKTFE